ncbi:unnamed protein product [Arctogadus glacialis]
MSTFNKTIIVEKSGGRYRRLHTFPQRRELHSTAIDDEHTSPSLLQSSMYDGSVTGWDQDLFPTSKCIMSHDRPFFERSQFQSPAKVFAKLKASVSRNTGGMKTYEKDGSVLPTTSEGAANTQEAKLMTNETSTFDPIGAEAMIISPTKSPQHKPPKSFLHCTKYRVPSPIRDTRHWLIKRDEYTPVKNPCQVTQQVPLSHKSMTLRSTKNVFRTPAIGQPQQLIHYESGGRPIIEATVCLERCPLMSPAKMFAYFKRSERKKAFLFPQKTAHGKKDVCMELSDDESQRFFPAEPSESDLRSIDEPTNSPVGNDVTDDLSPPARCPVVFNNMWLHDSEKALVSKRRDQENQENLVAPAKTYMQERKRLQPQEADYVGSSTREAGHRVQSWKRPASPDLKRVEAEYGTNMDRLPERKDNCFQSAATFESCRKDDSPIPARTSLLVLAEDPLINQSPCVSIPQINNPIMKRKPAPLEPIQPKQIPVQKGSGCELAKWTIKYNREGLYVDGIRTSDNTPWHSTIIVKRISGDVLRTLSGKTYTLIGPMNMHESSKFPNWLLSKFVHGFPPDWKKHFERFLSESKKDAASSSADIFPQGPGATKNAEMQSSTPFVTPSCPPPSSGGSSLAMKRSRCGRLLKPPLQFWKGGRVILDQSMNVTIMEDYENTVCMNKSFTLPTILEPEPPKLHGGLPQRRREATLPSEETGRPLVDQWQSSAPSVLRRKAKAAVRNRKAKTHASPEASAFPPEEEGRGQGTGSSSPEEQEPRARRGTEQQRLVLQAGQLAHRPDPRQRSDNDAPRIALPREQKIPVSKKPTLAHGSPASPSDEDIPVRTGRRRAACVLFDSLSSTSLNSMDGSWTLPRKDMGKTVMRTDKGKGRAGSPELAPDPLSSPAQPSKRGGRRTVPKAVFSPAQPSKRGGRRTVPKAVFSPAQPSKRGDGGTVPKAVSAPAQPSKRGDGGTVPKAVSAPAQPSKRGDGGTVPKAVSAPAQPSKRGDGGTVPKAVSAPAQPSKRGDGGTVPKAVSAPAQPSKRGDGGTVPKAVSAPAQPSKRGDGGTVPKAVSSPALPSKRGDGGTVPKAVSSPALPSKRGDGGTVPKAVSAPAQPSKRGDSGTAPKRGILQEEKVDWTEAELKSLKMAIASFPKHMGRYWVNVAMMVGTRSPEDCQTQHNFQESVKASSKNARVSGKKMDPPADQAPPAITARVGTLMRKQQVRQFMEAMPKEDNDDVFSSTAMQGKRFQMPSMSPCGMEQGFVLSDLEPTTPRGSSYCTARTPSGLHISPGMIRSVNRKKDDNYIYQLQKRMKRSQVNACKLSPPTKTFPLKPSVKRDDTSFEIWEPFPDNRGAQDDDSGEEQDDYFSDSD